MYRKWTLYLVLSAVINRHHKSWCGDRDYSILGYISVDGNEFVSMLRLVWRFICLIVMLGCIPNRNRRNFRNMYHSTDFFFPSFFIQSGAQL
nr:hypothetical protein CFP56_51092 [Quercus suber]